MSDPGSDARNRKPTQKPAGPDEPASRQPTCWQRFQCQRHDCPAHTPAYVDCWMVSETHCRDEIQGTFRVKITACLQCEFFQENAYASREVAQRTLAFVVRKLEERVAEAGEYRQALDSKMREIKALNTFFARLLDKKTDQEEAHSRLVENVEPLLSAEIWT